MSLTGESEMQPDGELDLDYTMLRRKLVNDFGGPVSLGQMRVFLRVRPLMKGNTMQKCLFVDSGQSVVLTAPEQSAVFRNNSSNEEKIKQRFTFTRVFGPSDDQKTFFKGAIRGTVSEFVNGQNCLVFAYGATNSGKTYTVQGSATSPGVIPNAVEVIFNSIGNRLDNQLNLRPINSCNVEQLTPKHMAEISASKETLLQGIEEFCTSMSSHCSDQSENLFDLSSKDGDESKLSIHESQSFRFQIWASFAEIYNENIFDLLDSSCPEKRKRLRLTLDNSGSSYIKDLKIFPVNSAREARQFLSLGRRNLHIASTKLNQSSSRSHCIFTIYMVKIVDSPDPDQAMINSLSFCDLAGSERVVKTQNSGERLKEAGKINNSLMVFGRCIEALRTARNSKERPMVPYRDSKLTQLFQFFFSGKGRASMIVNISPSVEMFDDTANVLKVSAIAKQVVSDQLEKTFLNLTSGSQRLTDLWTKSGDRWSSFIRGKLLPSKMSILTQKEDSVITEEDENEAQDKPQTGEDEPDIQELIDLVMELEKKCNSLMDENEQLEVKLRKELCEEFQTQMVNMENSYEKRIKKVKENADEYWEKRLEIAERALTIHTRYNSESSQESAENDEMDKNDTSASHEEREKKNVDLQFLLTTENNKLKEEIKVLLSELSAARLSLKEEKQQHDRNVFLLEEEVKSLSGKISQAELFLEGERSQFEKKIREDKDLQAANTIKIKALETELRNLISKISETSSASNNNNIQVDELQQKIKSLEDELEKTNKNWKTAQKESNRAIQDLEKLGDILFDKDAEIHELTTKIQKLEAEALCRQNLRLSLERHRQEALNSEQKVNELVERNNSEMEKKEAEINLLKAQITTFERINTSVDFQAPNTRPRRKPGRKPVNENKAPRDDSTSSLMDSSYLSKSSISSTSLNESSKDGRPAPLGFLDYIKQSPPILAARNAIDNIRGSVRIKPSSVDEPAGAGSIRKLRRKMYEKDSYEVLECTPPKQANTTENVHSIVTRTLRTRK